MVSSTLVLRALVLVLGLVPVLFILWAISVEDPLGGEPVAVVPLPEAPSAAAGVARAAPPAAPIEARVPAPAASSAAIIPPGKVITIIDGSSGQRQEVVLPSPTGVRPSPEKGGIVPDERLLEDSRHGRIPRIGPSGARAIEVYGRALAAALPAEGPRIAIVLGGLGIGAAVTADALSRLPPAVTLGFLPYGSELEGLVARARERGHEILLQAPMEPFDYPDNDPGPRTLLAALPQEQNIDRLHWAMSRFHGYVGIANYMGARFVTSEKALAPVLDEIGRRGLLYFDDGSAARSQAGAIAAARNLVFVKADVAIDAVPTVVEVDRALARLEAFARERGAAVGAATALPVSIDRIARWARQMEARGIALVPLTTIALKARSS